ncbi:uncharacterized protein LOC111889325 [Lactuca sativa]|nr:uncharacterized protein LOC111889325 [Lactuca sativa]
MMEPLPEHEYCHSLSLVDLQLEYPEEEEEDDDHDNEDHDDEDGDEDHDDDFDDDGDEDSCLITKEGFQGVCYRCGQEIHMYERYYYKCKHSSCDVSLHKFCGELLTRLEHALHPHPLSLCWPRINWRCNICKRDHKCLEMCYKCLECDFSIDVNCAVEEEKKIIHHPSHPHLLICLLPKAILCNCSACGKMHEGIFYQCTTCVGFSLHNDCAFLPKRLLINETSKVAFYHTHPLTISYSFPMNDQIAKHNPKCRVCGHGFYDMENLWIYKCDKCMYYAHVRCVTSRRESFLRAGLNKTVENFKNDDHPHLLHLPFPDETYSVPKQFFFKESGRSEEVIVKHMSHQHPLILVDQTQFNEKTSSEIKSLLLMCHNPKTKTQLICNGCMRPVMSTMPFYMCPERCNFVLHEWCTRLPSQIEKHPGHPQHTLLLIYSNVLPCFFGVFVCAVCHLPCNGFAYCCVKCKYYVDVTCGFIPKKITHKSHPNHLLSLVQNPSGGCHMCLKDVDSHQLSFSCNVCEIYIHPECALLFSETIWHSYDKHPMQLSYLPIENHKSEYFCEICEFYLNPHESFYHCQHCRQSIHTACAPLILESETHTYMYNLRSVYNFVNIKFGDIYSSGGHTHPLSFAQGIALDDLCNICGRKLQYKMIFKCHDCKEDKFAIDYNCCENVKRALSSFVSLDRLDL